MASAAESTEALAAESARVLSEYESAPWAERPSWHFDDNLKYASTSPPPSTSPSSSNEVSPSGTGLQEEVTRCSAGGCGKAAPEGGRLLRCSRCGAAYCGKECQTKAWRAHHKHECPLISATRNGEWTLDNSHHVMEELFRRVRMYMCPYAVGFNLVRGSGFVLLRSNATLVEWIHGHQAVDYEGRPLNRHVRLQYLTLGEFDALAFEDDFELAAVRQPLQEALAAADAEKHVVVVVVLACGYFACVTLPLVPDHRICKSLAAMYQYVEMDGPLQLNVDEQDA